VTAVVLAVLQAGAGVAGAAAPSTDGAGERGVAHPERWPALKPAVRPDRALEARVSALLARMSLEEKVGQVIQADIGSVTPEDVRTYHLGSVLAGGNSDPGGTYRATPKAWLDLADAFHAASTDRSKGGVGIPVLFGVDAVHGHNNLVGATLFPHNIGLGAAGDATLVKRIAEATAAELRATGIEWTFAPTVAVPRDDRWGRTYEGYSEDPALVARYSGAIVEGLQGRPGRRGFLDETRVLSSAKHFLADGATADGRDQGDAPIDESTLRDVHGAGYPPALRAGVQTVMASFSSWQGVKMHGNRSLLTGVLKERMGFDGFIVGDWNAHGQIPGCTNESCAAAINAGLDMFMAPDSWKGLYVNTLQQARDGTIPMARLDDAVRRILRVKARLGLLDAKPPSQRALGGRFELLGRDAHRALAREAVRKSLVLLKNEKRTLPIDPRRRVLVVGPAVDSVSQQAGGWTLTWQGTGVTPEDFPRAQSIWRGIEEQVRTAGGAAEYAPDGRYRTRPDVAIVVFGEEPYAEFQGDLRTLAYRGGRDDDLLLLRRLREQGIPTVTVFLSGRPLWVNREINASDAFVAAWLPGSEGGGVADVLLARADGKPRHDFAGRLSFSWPRTAVHHPNVGDPGYDPLFAVGYGLTYADARPVPPLPEDPGVDLSQVQSTTFLTRGAASKGWTVRAGDAGGAIAEAPQAPLRSPAGHVAIRRIDRGAQEDAWKITWTGDGAVSLVPGEAVDLSRETNGDVQLLVTMRVVRLGGDVTLAMGCGDRCEGAVPVGTALSSRVGQPWARVGIPLKCFRAAGADMAKLAVPFTLRAARGTEIDLQEVDTGTTAEVVLACP
jgi:beta-glucosidase